MKITRDSDPVGFQPVKLSVTIETPEELAALKRFFFYTASIPEYAARERFVKPEDAETLKGMMSGFFDSLKHG